jgi:predicted methyltransferase
VTSTTLRWKVALFLLASAIAAIAADVALQAANTLSRLDVIETERDHWQQPEAIIQALDLRPGGVVADLGCGAGYFTLKLSAVVGNRGTVLAADLRMLSLSFLWARTLLRHEHNVSIIHSKPDDPRLPKKVDAVLVVNTYHELADPETVLYHVFRSLAPAGRLVIADRGPKARTTDSRELEALHHEIPSTVVENELAHAGFEVVSRADNFLEQPDMGPWWLIVARKPRTGDEPGSGAHSVSAAMSGRSLRGERNAN